MRLGTIRKNVDLKKRLFNLHKETKQLLDVATERAGGIID